MPLVEQGGDAFLHLADMLAHLGRAAQHPHDRLDFVFTMNGLAVIHAHLGLPILISLISLAFYR